MFHVMKRGGGGGDNSPIMVRTSKEAALSLGTSAITTTEDYGLQGIATIQSTSTSGGMYTLAIVVHQGNVHKSIMESYGRSSSSASARLSLYVGSGDVNYNFGLFIPKGTTLRLSVPSGTTLKGNSLKLYPII